MPENNKTTQRACSSCYGTITDKDEAIEITHHRKSLMRVYPRTEITGGTIPRIISVE